MEQRIKKACPVINGFYVTGAKTLTGEFEVKCQIQGCIEQACMFWQDVCGCVIEQGFKKYLGIKEVKLND